MTGLVVEAGSPLVKPILVCGLARCGTSLVMQMLDAAGVACHGEFPAYEPEELSALNASRAEFVLRSAGALKVIDPHRSEWPARFDARIIWLSRDTREQAKSQIKFLRLLNGMDIPGQAWRQMRDGLKEDHWKCVRWWNRNASEPLFLKFEELLSDSLCSAGRIATHCDLPLATVPIMARQVRPRKPACASGLEMEMALIEKGCLA